MVTPRTVASRLLTSTICRQCRTSLSTAPRATLRQQPTLQLRQTPRITPSSFTSIRHHSTPPSSSTPKVYDFNDIQALTSTPDPQRILIDVREPHEYEAGYIPGAINLPIKSQPDALFLPEEEFEDRFGFEKPSQDAEVVFYCKSGVRSSAAAQLAVRGGWREVSEYRGSWLDWSGKGGRSEGGAGK